MKSVCIIGGGAAGMTAAICAARGGLKVTIIEHMPRLGKKLLLTGSGKCNLSNVAMNPSHFHGNNTSIIEDIFSQVSHEEVIAFLKSLGIEPKIRNGYYYPYCEQASAVLDCFRFTIRDLGIKVLTDTEVFEINPMSNANKYSVKTTDNILLFDNVILCCGSKAYSKTGSDGSGYNLAAKLGHTVVKPLPALTCFNCSESFFTQIAGIRTKASVSIVSKFSSVSDTGELQITKNGISGIPVFNISYEASKMLDKKLPFQCIIDFMPDMSIDEVTAYMLNIRRNHPKRSLEEVFSGYLHKNLSLCIIKQCNLKPASVISDISDKNLSMIAKKAKKFIVSIKSTGDFDNSQVCSGGVSTEEITTNMESKFHHNLYFAGEILDINGDCGGYNLHFAFATGIIAGRNCIND